MVPTVLDMVDSMDMVSAIMATVSTTARGRLRPSPTTMVPTVLDMVDSMDMVSVMDMATVSTTARGRPRLRPSPTTMEDMEGTDMPAPTEDSTAEDTTGDKS